MFKMRGGVSKAVCKKKMHHWRAWASLIMKTLMMTNVVIMLIGKSKRNQRIIFLQERKSFKMRKLSISENIFFKPSSHLATYRARERGCIRIYFPKGFNFYYKDAFFHLMTVSSFQQLEPNLSHFYNFVLPASESLMTAKYSRQHFCCGKLRGGRNFILPNFHFFLKICLYVSNCWVVTNCCICRICLMAGFPPIAALQPIFSSRVKY